MLVKAKFDALIKASGDNQIDPRLMQTLHKSKGVLCADVEQSDHVGIRRCSIPNHTHHDVTHSIKAARILYHTTPNTTPNTTPVYLYCINKAFDWSLSNIYLAPGRQSNSVKTYNTRKRQYDALSTFFSLVLDVEALQHTLRPMQPAPITEPVVAVLDFGGGSSHQATHCNLYVFMGKGMYTIATSVTPPQIFRTLHLINGVAHILKSPKPLKGLK